MLKELATGLRGQVEEVVLRGLDAVAGELRGLREDQAQVASRLAERVGRMEKVAGVRQSAEGQEALEASRRPSADNPFAGIFGNAVNQARRVMGGDDRREGR